MSPELGKTRSTPSFRSQNPLFRRVIIPWYDTEIACYLAVVFMAGVIAFSVAGIAEANSTPEFHRYVWVPIILLVMSVVVFISTLIRLVRRKYER